MDIRARVVAPSRILFGKVEGGEVIVLYNRHLTGEMRESIKASEGRNLKPIILFINTWAGRDEIVGIKGNYIIVQETKYIKVVAGRVNQNIPSREIKLVEELLKEFSVYDPEEDPIVDPIRGVLDKSLKELDDEMKAHKQFLLKKLALDSTHILSITQEYDRGQVLYTVEIQIKDA